MSMANCAHWYGHELMRNDGEMLRMGGARH